MSPVNTHKLMGFYMEVLVLGVTLINVHVHQQNYTETFLVLHMHMHIMYVSSEYEHECVHTLYAQHHTTALDQLHMQVYIRQR